MRKGRNAGRNTDAGAWAAIRALQNATVGGATVVNKGNLGATPSLALPSANVVMTGTLNANAALTVTGLVIGSVFSLVVGQDATGGRTLTLTNGSQAVSVDTTPLAVTTITCMSSDGTSIVITGGTLVDGGTP